MKIISPPYEGRRFLRGPVMIISMRWRTDDETRVLDLEAHIDIHLWDHMSAEERKFAFLGSMMTHLDGDRYPDMDQMIDDVNDFANAYEWDRDRKLALV